MSTYFDICTHKTKPSRFTACPTHTDVNYIEMFIETFYRNFFHLQNNGSVILSCVRLDAALWVLSIFAKTAKMFFNSSVSSDNKKQQN